MSVDDTFSFVRHDPETLYASGWTATPLASASVLLVGHILIQPYNRADEPSILVCLDTLPFWHFSISALMLTYHDARNRRDASRELREPTRSRARSMLDFR